jgi:pimeloyl-ACP methyl ester carboxylesterase
LLRLWKSQSGYPTRSELLDILVPYYSDERVQELFGQALDSKEVAVVETALRVISGMGDQTFSEQIIEIAEDEPRPEIRIQAIESMVELGLFDARDLLERMLLYEDFQVRKVAAWALRWLGDPTQTAPALWDARDGRHPDLRPLLVHAAAKLAAKTVLTDSRPAHYGVAPNFDVQEVYDEADAVRRDFKFRDETIEIITMGSDDEAVIVFLPLHYSDPAPILQALKDLADDRRVIFFRKKRPQGIAPHRVNLVMGRWFQEAADAILKDLQVTEPVDVLGWSMGSAWATLFCAAKPERCRRLLLASPMSLDFVFWEQTVPQLVRQLMPAPFDEDVVFLESVKNRFARRAWGIYYEQYLGRIQVGDSEASTALTQLRSPMLYKVPEAGFLDVERAFKKLVTNHVGMTVVVGGKDLFSGEWIRAAKLGNGQGVRLHRVPGIGHFALYEDPETTGKLLADGLD